MDVSSDADGLDYIEAHSDFLCNKLYRVMDAAKADAFAYFYSEDLPHESFLFATMFRYRAKRYLQEMGLKRCTVENVLNNGIHLKFPDSEYKIWKSISNPNATKPKRTYLTQPKFIQDPLPFQGAVNRYPMPLRQGSPLRLVVVWELNAGLQIELFLLCPKSLTPDFTGVNPHWKLPIPRRMSSTIQEAGNVERTSQSYDLDLDLTFERDDNGTESES